MFANCVNLVSINGISKIKSTKIINQKKMFYNCVHYHQFQILKNGKYEIIKYDKDRFLGLIITKTKKLKMR